MKLVESLHQTNILDTYPVVCFVSKEHPSLFIYFLISVLRKRQLSVEYIDSSGAHDAAIKAQLSMTFLGQRILYWLLQGREQKRDQASLLSYLACYKGPHAIWLSLPKALANSCVVEIPEVVDERTFNALYEMLFAKSAISLIFAQKLFVRQPQIKLEDAFLLMNYVTVLSRNQIDEFLDTWLNGLIFPEASLFSLSTAFFAKKNNHFFNLSKILSHHYPPIFWISFWSEQLFRARWFVYYARNKHVAQAKAISYKLPFTFIKKDWQLYTPSELDEAHNELYTIDYRLKNGCSPDQLEVFYHTFFQIKNSK
jgi:hypothetical protein